MDNQRSFEELQDLIIEWARVRGIYHTSDAQTQFLKAVSEMGELADALAKGQTKETYDAIGDIVVCLINLCHFRGITIPQALGLAYDEIANRKGKMINGVFIKDI